MREQVFANGHKGRVTQKQKYANLSKKQKNFKETKEKSCVHYYRKKKPMTTVLVVSFTRIERYENLKRYIPIAEIRVNNHCGGGIFEYNSAYKV